MNQPKIESAAVLAESREDGRNLVFLGDITSRGAVRYRYILAAFADGCDEPDAFVSSERNEFASAPEHGSHFLCVFAGGRHFNFGADNAWADPGVFLAAAVSILRDAHERVPG